MSKHAGGHATSIVRPQQPALSHIGPLYFNTFAMSSRTALQSDLAGVYVPKGSSGSRYELSMGHAPRYKQSEPHCVHDDRCLIFGSLHYASPMGLLVTRAVRNGHSNNKSRLTPVSCQQSAGISLAQSPKQTSPLYTSVIRNSGINSEGPSPCTFSCTPLQARIIPSWHLVHVCTYAPLACFCAGVRR